VQAVWSPPGRALVVEPKTVSTPGVADEVMDGMKPVKHTADLTVEEWTKSLPAAAAEVISSVPLARTAKMSSSSLSFVHTPPTPTRHSWIWLADDRPTKAPIFPDAAAIPWLAAV
jgi:hypothetical protein